MRYFKALLAVNIALRSGVMSAMGHPNGRADEPWAEYGDFAKDGYIYLALGPHHTEAQPWSTFVASALTGGAEEITEAEYNAAKPVYEF